jgi:hypothetical protein|tara:strand:- start:334 stop:591 length:258 start_codon:yes stop_codon:yes gene_type:complete
MAVKKSETDMNHVDQKVFKMAAMLDTTIRFHADSVQLDEKELTYADTWLKKERDPLLVTILATITGARDPENAEGAEAEGTAEAA